MRRWDVWQPILVWASRELYTPGKISTLGEAGGEQRKLAEKQNIMLLSMLALRSIVLGWEVEKRLECSRLSKV